MDLGTIRHQLEDLFKEGDIDVPDTIDEIVLMFEAHTEDTCGRLAAQRVIIPRTEERAH